MLDIKELSDKGNMKKVLVIIVNSLFVLLLVYGCIEYTFTPDFSEHEKTVPWLPHEATNISYKKDSFQQSYEFEISKQGFLDWLKEKNRHNVKVITLSPNADNIYKTVDRYNISIEKDYNKSIAKIRDGYYCEYIQDNGGGYRIGYDKIKGKAYYFSSSH